MRILAPFRMLDTKEPVIVMRRGKFFAVQDFRPRDHEGRLKNMCCCGKPTLNGETGYRWNNPDGPAGVYPVNPPPVGEGETILHDEPGRCGGLDSHSYHYRVVSNTSGGAFLLVQHGGGNERFRLSNGRALVSPLAGMDSNGRYWLLNAMFHAAKDAAMSAYAKEHNIWKQAAAEKRIKTRKQGNQVKVWVETAVAGGS